VTARHFERRSSISQATVPRISFAAPLPTHDHASDRPREPPAEKSFWALLPRRNLRRALFLLAALLAIVAIKRMGGFSLAKLFNDVAPAPPPASPSEPPVRHLEVKPR
jgi:hypothetical protein